MVLATSAHTARLLRDRVEETLGRKLPALPILCFAEFGLQLITERLDTLGLRPGFSLYDRAERAATIERLLREVRPQAAGLSNAVADRIGLWKRRLTLLASSTAAPEMSVGAVAAWIGGRYEQRLRAANAIDFDDIARKAVRLLTVDAALLLRWRDRVRFLFVDEYEYTNVCERELVRLLAADGMRLTAAADDTRTIDDPCRGSSDYLTRLSADLPNLRIMKLERNFRSRGRIAFAAKRIAGTTGESPNYVTPPGTPLRVMRSRNEQHEAEGIATAIATHQARYGTEYQDYAVLFRDLKQAAPIERALQTHHVPYRVYGAPSFFEQTEVQDLWAYLRLLCNPTDDSAFLRALNTPRRDIDHATLAQLHRFAANRGGSLLESALDPELIQILPPDQARTLRRIVNFLRWMIEHAANANPTQLVRDVIAELHYADWLRDTCNDAKIAAQRMNNVTRVVNMLQRFACRRSEGRLRSIITQFHLQAILNGDDEIAADGVTLSTFSAARGMEFAHVYIVGFEEGGSPATTPEDNVDAVSERHMLYRAVTRARESVTFTIAEQRRLAGGAGTRRASRFLADVPAQDLEWISPEFGRVFPENTLANSAAYMDRGNYRPR